MTTAIRFAPGIDLGDAPDSVLRDHPLAMRD